MIKWIGQHIVSLIARFRDDVYLENLEEQTQDHVVGIDDDGKLYKQDRGTTDSFTVEDGDTTDVVISNGKHWKFVEGGNIDINWTDTSTGSSSDEYDLTFGVSTRPSFEVVELISPYTIESRESVKIQVDSANTANANHVFDFVNGAGDTIGKLDKDGNLSIKGELRTLSAGGKGDLGQFVEANIPNLNADKVNDGTFADARIPNLGASKITSGTFGTSQIPSLDTGKITTGTLSKDRYVRSPVFSLTQYSSTVADDIHIGNSTYGNSHFNWNQALDKDATSLNKNFENCGCYIPEAVSKVIVKASVRLNASETLILAAFKAPAAPSSGNLVLTHLDDDSTSTYVTASSTSARYVNITLTHTGTIAADSVIFVGCGQDGGTNGRVLKANISVLTEI
jgi:hypothetical protein